MARRQANEASRFFIPAWEVKSIDVAADYLREQAGMHARREHDKQDVLTCLRLQGFELGNLVARLAGELADCRSDNLFDRRMVDHPTQTGKALCRCRQPQAWCCAEGVLSELGPRVSGVTRLSGHRAWTRKLRAVRQLTFAD